MTKEQADHVVVHSLYSLVSHAYEEIELVIKSDQDISRRIPQIGEAYTHLQAAEKLLREAITHVESTYTVDAD